MISINNIKLLFEQWQQKEQIFVVDVQIRAGNKIIVLIDKIGGLSIHDCVALSRYIENQLDRDKEDFELSVSSPGADSPFKVFEQYEKNIGRKVSLVTDSNEIIKGTLLTAQYPFVEIEKEKNKKNKNETETTIRLNINHIKETRVLISFK